MAEARWTWMAQGGYGLMVHWIAPGPLPRTGTRVEDLNEAVDRFDLPRFESDFLATGADWLIFTVGQNKGYYASPNRVLDAFAGPGHTPRRDLVAEIAARLRWHRKRFIAYVPCEFNWQKPEFQDALGWVRQPGTAQEEFQRRYTRVIGEWGRNWGPLCDGWWFDGCYDWECFPNTRYDWALWDRAARAGNPDRVVTFNDGSFCLGKTVPAAPHHDYLSGEVEVLADGQVRMGRSADAPRYTPASNRVPGMDCLVHALLPVDCYWAYEFASPGTDWPHRFAPFDPQHPGPMPDPMYGPDELRRFFQGFQAVRAPVTFNIGIYQDGSLAPLSVELLRGLKSPSG